MPRRPLADSLSALLVATTLVVPAAHANDAPKAGASAPKAAASGTPAKAGNPCGPSNPCGPAKKRKKSSDNPCAPKG